eukprot:scpid58763/ scgid3592/ 
MMTRTAPGQQRGLHALSRTVPLALFTMLVMYSVDPAMAQPPAPPSPVGTAAGRYLPLPDRRLLKQKLPGGLRQLYTFTVPAGGNVSITVFPCQGHVSWNITYVGARVFSHPRYPTGKRRKKRCCVTGGVTTNFNFNIAGLASGLGTSMGDGAITYFLEDTSGGTYYISLTNNSPMLASYEMYATLRPAISPYVQLPNDPQAKVTAIRDTELELAWMPVRAEPWGGKDVVYCVEYHKTDDRVDSDVRSSTCAAHRYRPGTKKNNCVPGTSFVLKNLTPSTQYSIDVFARNLRKHTETAYLSVTASTAEGSATPLSNVAERVTTLLPMETRVFRMRANQQSATLSGVSPCTGNLKWSILDASGNSIQDYGFGTSPGMQLPAEMVARPQNFVNNLPSVDRQYSSQLQRGTEFSIAVSNVNAHGPSSFEMYTAVNQHMSNYPQMPRDRQITPGQVTASSVSLKWRPVLNPANVTYCVHVFPHNQAVRNGVVHSACGISTAERRRMIAQGQCSPHIYRTVSGLRASVWYDVSVVAKNQFTLHQQAYSGLMVLTGRHPSNSQPGLQPGLQPGFQAGFQAGFQPALNNVNNVRRLQYSSALPAASHVAMEISIVVSTLLALLNQQY